jgi:hypothetical protein
MRAVSRIREAQAKSKKSGRQYLATRWPFRTQFAGDGRSYRSVDDNGRKVLEEEDEWTREQAASPAATALESKVRRSSSGDEGQRPECGALAERRPACGGASLPIARVGDTR